MTGSHTPAPAPFPAPDRPLDPGSTTHAVYGSHVELIGGGIYQNRDAYHVRVWGGKHWKLTPADAADTLGLSCAPEYAFNGRTPIEGGYVALLVVTHDPSDHD